MDASLVAEVWKRLIQGSSLDGLGVPMKAGRVDLHGLVAPDPKAVRPYAATATTAKVKARGNLITIQGAHWKGIDFTGAQLGSLRFFESKIEDCSFERAKCTDWRMWGTSLSNTSFLATDLRSSALGGIAENGKRNSFRHIDFTRADLRGTAYKSCDMIYCKFADTKLAKVDFQGTVFEHCTFEGQLDDVLFYRHAFGGEDLPPNEMKEVDLRRAKLRYVDFRRLDMTSVKWPEGNDYLVLQDYPAALDRALNMLNGRTDEGSRVLRAVLANKRKWVGPHQTRGVLSIPELVSAGGEAGAAEMLQLFGANAECL